MSDELDQSVAPVQPAPDTQQPPAPDAPQPDQTAQAAGYGQQYGYPYGYQQPQQQQPAQPQQPNYGYYQPQYVPLAPREPNPLLALTFGIVSLVLLFFSSSLLTGMNGMYGYRKTLLIVFYVLSIVAELAFGIIGMIIGRKAMNAKPCGRASTSYVFGLVDTCLGGASLLTYLISLILTA